MFIYHTLIHSFIHLLAVCFSAGSYFYVKIIIRELDSFLIYHKEVNSMSAKRNRIPQYGTVEINGHTYYRTMVTDAEGNRISLYAKTRAEL